jgi:S1-C subfamily serine protease
MRAHVWILAAAFLAGPASLGVSAAPQDAVVRIISTTDGIHDNLGSGFFISPDGRVLTCYHVVSGARKLTILDGVDWHEDVTVIWISPDYDLAMLSVNGLRRPVSFISIHPENPAAFWKSPLEVYGLPTVLGIGSESKSYFRVRSLSEGFSLSTSIRSQGEVPRQLFAREIDVIAVDMTIYNGDSGGPLVHNNYAVGVISGSIEEGGSIAWAIPLKYLSTSLTTVNKPAIQIAWPPLGLMKLDSWKTARKEAKLGATLVAALDRYGNVVHSFVYAIPQLFQTSRDIYSPGIAELGAVVSKEIARKGANFPAEDDPVIENTAEKVVKGWEASMGRLKNLDDLGQKLGDSSEDLARELARYLKALPRTKKNVALQASIVDRWERNRAALLALCDRSDSEMDAWENKMGDSFDKAKTLGDSEDGLGEFGEICRRVDVADARFFFDVNGSAVKERSSNSREPL